MRKRVGKKEEKKPSSYIQIIESIEIVYLRRGANCLKKMNEKIQSTWLRGRFYLSLINRVSHGGAKKNYLEKNVKNHLFNTSIVRWKTMGFYFLRVVFMCTRICLFKPWLIFLMFVSGCLEKKGHKHVLAVTF